MKTMKELSQYISNALYALRGGKFIRIKKGDSIDVQRQNIGELAWSYLEKTYPNDWRPVSSKLHLVDAVLNSDTPYIHISVSQLSKHPFVTFHGTPEELQLLQSQEYDVLNDNQDDAI